MFPLRYGQTAAFTHTHNHDDIIENEEAIDPKRDSWVYRKSKLKDANLIGSYSLLYFSLSWEQYVL